MHETNKIVTNYLLLVAMVGSLLPYTICQLELPSSGWSGWHLFPLIIWIDNTQQFFFTCILDEDSPCVRSDGISSHIVHITDRRRKTAKKLQMVC